MLSDVSLSLTWRDAHRFDARSIETLHHNLSSSIIYMELVALRISALCSFNSVSHHTAYRESSYRRVSRSDV